MMKSLELLSGILFLLLGMMTSFSDLKEGCIYNRTLLIFTGLSAVIDLIYYGYYARDLFLLFLINFIMLAVISLVLFYSHSFAGGDCKLVLVMGLLYPADYYLVYGNTAVTIFFALGIAILYGYAYLLLASVYGLLSKKNQMTKEYVKNYLFSFLKSFVSATIYISGVHLLIITLAERGIYINSWIVRLICIGLAWLIGKYDFLRKMYVVLLVLAIDLIGGVILGTITFSVNLENYILVLALLLCQMTIRTSLYEEVQITDIKKGMILSMGASLLMQGSRVRGLPGISSEDLKSRLTEEETESIKRWAKSKKIESLLIVKKIPFAVFIFLGFISYFLIWSVV